MDSRITDCPGLTELDIDLLYKIETGLPIVADVSRTDVLLCGLLSLNQAIVLQHIAPQSISSHYRQEVTGRAYSADERPLILNGLRSGNRASRKRQVLRGGAPVIQEVRPIYNSVRRVIGVLVFESNMIEYERHRRRDRNFRRAVQWLQEMGAHGEIEEPEALRRFGPFDGVYLIGRDRRLQYMSGIATNMFRSIGRRTDLRGQDVSVLEEEDSDLADQAFDAHRCYESRNEYEDNRVWIRGTIPLREPPSPLRNYSTKRVLGWIGINTDFVTSPSSDSGQSTDGALVLVHNATETIQRERELNVKSAIIQEVHHRVKNNLQTIAAMMRIQARRSKSEEAKQQLTDAVNRILSMSVIHEFLSQDEHRPINVRDVCQRIANQVMQVMLDPEQQVSIVVTGPNIRLPAGQATPTAMAINELLLNAIEHGLSGQKRGHIQVQLTDLGNAVRIAILNDGNNLPAEFDAAQSGTLGLQIVNTLVTDDLKGQLTIEPLLYKEEPTQTTEPELTEPELVVTAHDADPNVAQAIASSPPEPAPLAGGSPRFSTQALLTFPKRALNAD